MLAYQNGSQHLKAVQNDYRKCSGAVATEQHFWKLLNPPTMVGGNHPKLSEKLFCGFFLHFPSKPLGRSLFSRGAVPASYTQLAIPDTLRVVPISAYISLKIKMKV